MDTFYQNYRLFAAADVEMVMEIAESIMNDNLIDYDHLYILDDNNNVYTDYEY